MNAIPEKPISMKPVDVAGKTKHNATQIKGLISNKIAMMNTAHNDIGLDASKLLSIIGSDGKPQSLDAFMKGIEKNPDDGAKLLARLSDRNQKKNIETELCTKWSQRSQFKEPPKVTINLNTATDATKKAKETIRTDAVTTKGKVIQGKQIGGQTTSQVGGVQTQRVDNKDIAAFQNKASDVKKGPESQNLQEPTIALKPGQIKFLLNHIDPPEGKGGYETGGSGVA